MMRSLYAGVSGLKNHQTRMDVIGNNIANVNTTGFKGSRVTFQDMLSQSVSSAASPQGNRGGTNPQQVGLGMGIASIDTIFTDGNTQSTGKTTDIAISGNGFFVLADGDKEYYTRNGAFDFDTQGNYVEPGSGLMVKGWMADANGVINTTGSLNNIVIPSGQSMAAKATDSVTYGNNLDAGAKYATTTTTETSTETTNVQPTFAVGDKVANDFYIKSITEKEWTVTQSRDVVGGTRPALGDTDSDGKTTAFTANAWLAKGSRTANNDPALDSPPLSVGSTDADGFKITAITAPVAPAITWKIDGEKRLTTDPAGPYTSGAWANVPTADSEWKVTKEKTGVTVKPTIGGDSNGYTVGQAVATKWEVVKEKSESRKSVNADVPFSNTIVTGTGGTLKTVRTMSDPTTCTTQITAYDSQGVKHMIDAVLTKTDNNEWTLKGSKTSTGYDVQGCDYTIKFDENGKFSTVTPATAFSFSPKQADTVTVMPDFKSMTQFAGESNVSIDYTGYAAGTLQSRGVDSSGIIVGTYSNGQKKNLAQVAMATFNNPAGLEKNGGSLYSESNNSGRVQINTAGKGGAGKLSPGNIEMSNVNLSEQFSDMIITQRGFQSNSKIITVSDEMIDTLVNMKR